MQADTGQPLADALISSGTRTTYSDADGRFELSHLPAGLYTVTVSKSGFVTMSYGVRHDGEGARPIKVGIGENVRNIDVALPRGGVITGTVLDRYGQPLVSTPVWLLRVRAANGERRLVAMNEQDPNTGAAHMRDVTDDQGQFRLFGLLPGTYYVAVGQPLNPQQTNRAFGLSTESARVLYPGTASLADAQPISVSEGAEIAGLSFVVEPSPEAEIRGVLTSNSTRGQSQLRLVQHGTISGDVTRQVNLAADGSFAVARLTPGVYTLLAFAEGQIGRVTVNLGTEDLFVPMALGSGSAMSGRILFEGAPASSSGQPTLKPKDVQVTYILTDFSSPQWQATVDQDWTFRASGILGPVRIGVRAPGWFVKRISRNGVDVTDSPIGAEGDVNGIVVLLTQQVTTLNGRVLDERSRPTPDATIVVFAESPNRWGPNSRYVRMAGTDQEGRFGLEGLPPARYVAVALDYVPEGEESNPDFLQSLTRLGQRIDLAAGERKTIELRRKTTP